MYRQSAILSFSEMRGGGTDPLRASPTMPTPAVVPVVVVASRMLVVASRMLIAASPIGGPAHEHAAVGRPNAHLNISGGSRVTVVAAMMRVATGKRKSHEGQEREAKGFSPHGYLLSAFARALPEETARSLPKRFAFA